MITFESTIHIEADAASVWSTLTDTARYPEWDSGVIRVEGEVALARKLNITSAVDPERAFPARVTTLRPPSPSNQAEMIWTGGMPLGLFRGVRTFTLEEIAGGTRFRIREVFSGPLLRLIARTLPDLQPSFDQFAAGLKAESERAVPRPTATHTTEQGDRR